MHHIYVIGAPANDCVDKAWLNKLADPHPVRWIAAEFKYTSLS